MNWQLLVTALLVTSAVVATLANWPRAVRTLRRARIAIKRAVYALAGRIRWV